MWSVVGWDVIDSCWFTGCHVCMAIGKMLTKETLGNGDAGSLRFIFTAVEQSLKLSPFEFWADWFVYFFKDKVSYSPA